MSLRWLLILAALAAGLPGTGLAQSPSPNVTGTWEVDTPEGPERLVVRADSSASFGDETVRWRLLGEIMYIAFGDEWVGYDYILQDNTLTFSGGDLEEPISMVRVGPATPRPANVPLPPPPPMTPRSGG
jgi:hypothetical protein